MITKTAFVGAWLAATLLLVNEARAVEPLSTPELVMLNVAAELNSKETYSERAMRTRK